MIVAMAEAPRAEEQARPTVLLFVYSWDLLLAILAVFGALAPFAGGLATSSGQSVSIALPLQIMLALSSASYAAALIIAASLLTRRRRWVRSLQMTIMGVAVVLAVLSVLVSWLVGAGLPVASTLGIIFFVLVDVLTLVLMTERRVVDWYVEPGPPPWYATASVGFWALTGCAVVALIVAVH
jgi:hypothetical protein